MKRIKVLQVGASAFVRRGVENFMQNLASQLDSDKVQFDVLTPTECRNDSLRRQVEAAGGNVIELHCSSAKGLRYWEFCHKLRKVILQAQYQVVEIHTGSIPILALGCWTAKKAGVAKVIAHTANTQTDSFRLQAEKRLFFPFFQYADCFWGCSIQANQDTFPKHFSEKAKVIPYGIPVEHFKYHENIRNQMRSKLSLEERLVIGHIGAFTQQKNHSFLLQVFQFVHQKRPDAVLLLVGEGERYPDIWAQVHQMGLEDSVIFYGATSHISQLLCAMDLFCFPSLWEGLGITLIEAQASGLPCLVSQAVQPETILLKEYYWMDLAEGAARWAERLLEIAPNTNRVKSNEVVAQSVYQLSRVARMVENEYCSSELRER